MKILTPTELYNRSLPAGEATNEYLAAYDAMKARETPEKRLRDALINEAAHCNQAVIQNQVVSQAAKAAEAYRADAAGTGQGMEVAA